MIAKLIFQQLQLQQWQQSECIRLGISPEEHKKIIELSQEMSAAMDISFIACYSSIEMAIKRKEEYPNDNTLLPANPA